MNKTKFGSKCPEFYPTSEEFSNFSKYVEEVIEPECRHIGLCKIIPPNNWFHRSYSNLCDRIVSKPVSQHIAGKKGIYTVDLVERSNLSLNDYQNIAKEHDVDQPKDNETMDEIERKFWKSLRYTMKAPMYGADILGSLFEDSNSSWNLNNLNTILRHINLPGISYPMLYYGMWRSMFALHTEDMDLFSINYLHSGSSKFWYGISPDKGHHVERVAQSLFPEDALACRQFLRHKTCMISPTKLREYQIPYVRTIQHAGEFVITFPASYHCGFNLGFNIAEAVNFATIEWISKGLQAKICQCRPDSVRIDMRNFLHHIFREKENKTNDVNDSTWIFLCICGHYGSNKCSSSIYGRMFECSQCSIWMHLKCCYPDLIEIEDQNLPETLLCNYCISEDEDSKDSNNIQQISKESISLSSIKSLKRNYSAISKSFKGWKIVLKGSTKQGYIANITGEYFRVHFKGCSTEQDEWIKMNSSDVIDILPPTTESNCRKVQLVKTQSNLSTRLV